MPTYRGQHIKIDYTGLKKSAELQRAMELLDRECRFGCGGTFDISEPDEEASEAGALWEAVFNDFSSDTLFFDGNRWMEWDKLCPNEDEHDDDEDIESRQSA